MDDLISTLVSGLVAFVAGIIFIIKCKAIANTIIEENAIKDKHKESVWNYSLTLSFLLGIALFAIGIILIKEGLVSIFYK